MIDVMGFASQLFEASGFGIDGGYLGIIRFFSYPGEEGVMFSGSTACISRAIHLWFLLSVVRLPRFHLLWVLLSVARALRAIHLWTFLLAGRQRRFHLLWVVLSVVRVVDAATLFTCRAQSRLSALIRTKRRQILLNQTFRTTLHALRLTRQMLVVNGGWFIEGPHMKY